MYNNLSLDNIINTQIIYELFNYKLLYIIKNLIFIIRVNKTFLIM